MAGAARATFLATLERSDSSAGHLRVPAAVMAKLGTRKRLPVVVTIRGVSYRSTTSVYGGECYLPVRAEIREQTGMHAGDRIRVGLQRDDAPREVEVPDDMTRALRAAKLLAYFASTSYSHKREHVAWVEQAKRPETRARRIDKFVEVLRAKAGLG